MSPKPFTENDPREHTKYPQPEEDPLAPARGIFNAIICCLVIWACLIGAVLIWTRTVQARTNSVQPIAAPQSLTRAREACPNHASLVECRGELRKAYAAITWQRDQNLKLAREMVGNVTAWQCIHQGEGAWNATGFYHGGLQMDWTFMRTYGRDMLRRHGGVGAEAWTPREQIIVAQRAFVQGRGYAPWPATSRACGLR